MTGQIMKKNCNGPVLISIWEKTNFGKLIEFPSIQFGVEMAFLSQSETPFLLFPSEFYRGAKSIQINGLV
jgi:hypothetical protein